TLYGDLAGGLAVIGDCSKEKVYALADYINRNREIIPLSTIKKAPSAELKPNQKDSDTLPPYPLIDRVIEAYVENHERPEAIAKRLKTELETIKDIIRRIHQAEYKRRQAPPSLRISPKSFSIGRRYPIVQKFII
ncbi:MAG: NAD(+) synthase, partial [Parachlamydiaceae bacterium]